MKEREIETLKAISESLDMSKCFLDDIIKDNEKVEEPKHAKEDVLDDMEEISKILEIILKGFDMNGKTIIVKKCDE